MAHVEVKCAPRAAEGADSSASHSRRGVHIPLPNPKTPFPPGLNVKWLSGVVAMVFVSQLTLHCRSCAG